MRRVYESCGKLEIDQFTNAKTFTVKTHLPELKKGGQYQYVNYYNISTKDHYGIIGVLIINGEPNDSLITYPDAATTSKLRVVDAKPIDLLKDLKPFGDKDFSNLTKDDKVSFICFHDNDFETNDSVHNILKNCQADLPNFDRPVHFFLDVKEVLPKSIEKIFEPMRGNGGILTITDCV